jgi:putative DNA primase/helicase
MPDGGKGFTISGMTSADEKDDGKQSQREKISDAVLIAGVTFWHDKDGHAYATVPCNIAEPDGAIMHLPVRRRRFSLICRRLYGATNPVSGQYGDRPGSVSDSAMGEAIPAFEAMALEQDEAFEPGVRLIDNRGAIWIDLGDDTYRAIRVTAEGWAVVKRVDAPLIRSDGLRALPTPVPTTDALARLHKLLNITDDDEGKSNFKLIVAWLVAALYPSGPYPLIALDGEQGSGKTTAARILRKMVDPNAADLRAMPRNEDDLLIAALNGRVVALDNVSFVENDMADALCRVATGAGFGKRTLYSDLGETIVAVARPILLNGIPSLLARGDLADRSIAVTMPPIPDEKRRPESAVWDEFEAAAPGILAPLLDGLVTAIKRLPTLKLDCLPRMADFARLACAAAPAFDWTEADMLKAMDMNRKASVETVAESDPIAGAVRAILGDNPTGREGTASQQLDAVNIRLSAKVRNGRGWPKDGARLSTRVKRVARALRRVGVGAETVREGHDRTRKILIRRLPGIDKTHDRTFLQVLVTPKGRAKIAELLTQGDLLRPDAKRTAA